MIPIEHILLSVAPVQALLLLLDPNLLPSGDFEEWLNDDGFSEAVKKDGNKKFLFLELEKLKARFRADLHDQSALKDSFGNPLTPLGIYNLIEGHKNRISKVRLLIEHELQKASNLHKPSGVKYIVMRAYWIDSNGKKVRKFSRNLGPEDKVLVKGKIPTSTLDETEKEIDRMMWEQYKAEYPE